MNRREASRFFIKNASASTPARFVTTLHHGLTRAEGVDKGPKMGL
jgi:hypothetical protein